MVPVPPPRTGIVVVHCEEDALVLKQMLERCAALLEATATEVARPFAEMTPEDAALIEAGTEDEATDAAFCRLYEAQADVADRLQEHMAELYPAEDGGRVRLASDIASLRNIGILPAAPNAPVFLQVVGKGRGH
jgi:hypothetical protein